MRILFMTQVLPLPLDAGPKVRSYYVLSYLAQAGHEISLLSFVRPDDTQEQIRSLRQLCRSVKVVPIRRSRVADAGYLLRTAVCRTPFLILRDQSLEMELAVDEAARKRSFDAIHADQLWMAPYAQNCCRPGLSVLDQHNAVFVVFRRMCEHERNPVKRAFLRHETARLEAFERSTCKSFDQVVWVTDEDHRAVGGESGRRRRDKVIPIAVDTCVRQPLKRTAPFRVTFLGGMHWPPNAEGVRWFVREIWPAIAEAVPDAVLTVVGKRPPAIFGQADASRVHVTGYLDDPQTLLAETAAFIVPLRSGAGMRVKILDAWCWGLPVVSTTLGAEGLHAVAGENLALADDAGPFAEAVIRIFKNGAYARMLSENGRATSETFYDWRKVYTAWNEIYR